MIMDHNRNLLTRALLRKFPYERQPPLYLRGLLNQLDRVELKIVRRVMLSQSHPTGVQLALIINKSGDGWLYPPLALGVIAGLGVASIKPVLLAVVSVCVAHLIYPLIKQHMSRLRPFEKDPALIAVCLPLDRYSCPSGHCMTATAAFLPLGLAYPLLGYALVIAWSMLAWARLALGHHYPSDILIGAGLGAAVVVPCILSSNPWPDTFFATLFSQK
jgi:undecaprenyl-diphosphatase